MQESGLLRSTQGVQTGVEHVHWPPFIETLKTRFLADEASLFLLHGAVEDPFDIDGNTWTAGALVAELLAATRDVVGVVAPEGLRFPNFEDLGRFERALKSAQVMTGTHFTVDRKVRAEVIGEVWLAMDTATTTQAWLFPAIEALYPAKRNRLEVLGGNAPHLWGWADHVRLRRSNHIVVCFTHDLSLVRPELVEAASCIEVVGPALAPDTLDVAYDEAEVEALSPPPPMAAPAPPPADLRATLEAALAAAFTRHPEEDRPSGVPVMEAVARVVARFDPALGDDITLSLSEEGEVVGTGQGAEDFLQRWRADIALSASAGMITSELGADLAIDATGLGALTRRVQRWIDRL